MPIHDWTRAFAGTFHDFHSSWITHLKEALNAGLLPRNYYAMAEQHVHGIVPDVLTLTGESSDDRTGQHHDDGMLAVADAPPKVSIHLSADEQAYYRIARRTLTIRHRSSRQVVAMIEIVSPGNKDGPQHLEQFIEKAVAAIQHGIHLLIVDLFPPGRSDPDGIHGAIWNIVGGSEVHAPADKPLVVASYSAGELPEAFVEPLAIGDALPQMPLFLDVGRYVETPLERTYMQAFQGMPGYVKEIVEGHAEPERA